MNETDFRYETLQLQPDYEGKAIATLIAARANTGSRKSVLYLHGFIDYFFHPHLAEAFGNNDYDFYALELRKYGHSLLPHQHPNYCRSMDEYFEELDMAIEKIAALDGSKAIILLGHSTGGLLSSYYMNKGRLRKMVSGMVLNSPFLELNEPLLVKIVAPVFAKLIAAIAPYAKKDGAISPIYAQSVHREYFGEWDFNLEWKPIAGFPAYFAWVNAITKAQRYLNQQSDISIPLLVMHAGQSSKLAVFTELAHKTDTVLNIDHIARRGPKLGTRVDTIVIQNGMHDLFLSPPEVRGEALEKMFGWLRQNFG